MRRLESEIMPESHSSVEFESSHEGVFSRILEWVKSLSAAASAPNRIVNFLIVLNLAMTLPLACKLSIITDEAFSLQTTSKGVVYAFKQALYFELQAPLYFVLLDIWRGINDSIFFARLFSVLSIALTIKVVALLSQRLFRKIHPGWLAAAVALHPYTAWAATEIRLYAFGILLSSLLLLLFYDGYLAEKPRRSRQIIYLLLSIAALYTQYYLGFLLVANACVLLLLRRWRLLFSYLLGMLAVGLSFTPMALVVLGQVSTHTQTVKSALPWEEGLRVITWEIKEFILPVKPEERLGQLERLRRWVFRFGYVAIAVLLVKNYRRRLNSSDALVWSSIGITTLFYLAAIHVTGEAMLQSRHSFALFIPSSLLAFSLVAKFAKTRARVAWLIAFLIFSSISLYFTFRPLTKNGSWDRVASYIMASEKPDQPVLVFHAGNALTLSYYYRGPNALVPLPRGDKYDTFDINNYVLRDEQEITAAIARVPGDHQQLWLVTDNICHFMDVNYNCEGLEAFVEKYYEVEKTETFFNSKVRLLRRKSTP